MKIKQVLALLWKRHLWDLILFYITFGCSIYLSLKQSFNVISHNHWELVGGFELAGVLWFVGRVALSQSAFRLMGNWQVLPFKFRHVFGGELLFLLLGLIPYFVTKIVMTEWLLEPSFVGWQHLIWQDWMPFFFKLGLVVVLLKVMAIPLEDRKTQVRSRYAWAAMIVLMLTAALVPRIFTESDFDKSLWLSMHDYNQENEIVLSPINMSADGGTRWLRKGGMPKIDQIDAASTSSQSMPLKEGARYVMGSMLVEIISVEVIGGSLRVKVKRAWGGNLEAHEVTELGRVAPMMIEYENGYFGGVIQYFDFRLIRENIVLIPRSGVVCEIEFFSPIILRENENEMDEILNGARLHVALRRDHLVVPSRFSGGFPKRQISAAGKISWEMNLWHGDHPTSQMVKELFGLGKQGVRDLLNYSPWSTAVWDDAVFPYLVKFADESHRKDLLPVLEVNPLIGDLFVEKGWSHNALPDLRKHLEKGHALGKRSLVALAKLKEPEMGSALEKQFLRQRGDLNELAAALEDHPGVDWAGLKLRCWQNSKAGYGWHHLYDRWGAEAGDLEALRSLLRSAHEGEKWEREILEDWFGPEEVVQKLRENWERVRFENDRWILGV